MWHGYRLPNGKFTVRSRNYPAETIEPWLSLVNAAENKKWSWLGQTVQAP
jgi:hypothetical protein